MAVALIAGAGALPQLIAESLSRAQTPYIVAGFEGQLPGWLVDHPNVTAPFEKLGRVIAAFRAAGATQLCMAGGMQRPSLNPLKFDATFARFAPYVLPRLREGDDAALHAVALFFEREGFEIIPAEQLLPDALIRKGTLVGALTERDSSDIARAFHILDTMAPLDIGQGCVVAEGLCLGVETLQGTDAMLTMIAAETKGRDSSKPCGVLVKRPKAGQDKRIDLPSIGPETIRKAASAGLAGIAVEADGALMLEADATRALAQGLGLFLAGIEP